MSDHIDSRNGNMLTATPMWESLARRQIVARMKAEAENEKLKCISTSQAHTMNELLGILKRIHHTHQPSWVLQLGVAFEVSPHESALVSEDEILRYIGSHEPHWQSVFTGHRSAGDARDLYDARVFHFRTQAREIVHEVHASQLLPFPVAQVCDAAWAMCQEHLRVDENEVYKQAHHTQGDVVMATYVEMRRGDQTRAISGKFATKRLRKETSSPRPWGSCQSSTAPASKRTHGPAW